mgnify:CR=1 FL=1
MEKKNKSFIFVILAMIIIIAIMGYCIYNLYIEKTNTKEEIDNLKNQISSLESKNNEAQEENGKNENENTNINANTDTNNNKYTEISSELNGIDVLYVTNVIKANDRYTLQGVLYTQYILSNSELQDVISKGSMEINDKNYIIKNTSNSKEYDLYDSAQNEITYKIKESDENTYYLEAQAQISDVWKLTNEYKEIKVSKDTKCSMLFDYDEKYNKVEDVFNNYSEEKASETTNPDSKRTFKFKFTNGKCTEVINVLTSL